MQKSPINTNTQPNSNSMYYKTKRNELI